MSLIMNNEKTLKTETTTGILEFKGIPVANDFNHKEFAISNGFNNTHINSHENTDKYGGVGFVVYKNFSTTEEVQYHLRQTLTVLFVNGLPVMYRLS